MTFMFWLKGVSFSASHISEFHFLPIINLFHLFHFWFSYHNFKNLERGCISGWESAGSQNDDSSSFCSLIITYRLVVNLCTLSSILHFVKHNHKVHGSGVESGSNQNQFQFV